jgi:hypothetical protein
LEKRSKSSRRSKIRRIGQAATPIWRKPKRETLPEVDPDEWDYSGCPDNQLVYCYLYTLTRLICLERAPRLQSDVKKLRRKAEDPISFDSLAKVAFDLVGPGSGTWRLLVAFPEWPKLPWLAIEGEERERRLKILFSDYYPTHSESSAKDILPARLPNYLVHRLEAAMKAYGLPVIPIGSGCWSIAEVDLMKLQGKEIDWSKLELVLSCINESNKSSGSADGLLVWSIRKEPRSDSTLK